MSAYEREKGKRAEREAAAWWRERGVLTAARGRQFQGHPDAPDVRGVPGVHIEVKHRQAWQPYQWLADVKAEAERSKIPIVQCRRDHQDWVFLVDAQYFILLYRAWMANSGVVPT